MVHPRKLRLNYTLGCLWIGLCVVGDIAAQNPYDTLWTRTYGTGDREIARAVEQTSDGGFMIAGYTGMSSRDVHLVKADASGNVQWAQRYGGNSWDEVYSAQQTSDGGYVLAGYTASYGNGHEHFYVVKTRENGDVEWSNWYGDGNNQRGHAVQQTLDGGFIIAGFRIAYDADHGDVYLIKTYSNGSIQWSRTYGTFEWEEAWAVQQTADHGYILAGRTSAAVGGRNCFVVKTDSLGDSLWAREFGGEHYDEAFAIRQLGDGGYVVTGYSDGDNGADAYLVRLDPMGYVSWAHTYDSGANEYGQDVRQTNDGGFLVTGYRTPFGGFSGDYCLIKTNSVGDTLWTCTYGGSGNEEAYALELTTDGGCVIAGVTDSYGMGNGDFFLVKIRNDIANRAFESPAVPLQIELSVAPNPFNTNTTISFSLSHPQQVSGAVYDDNGRQVKVIAQGLIQVGEHRVSFDGTCLSSGIYFVSIRSAESATSKKLVLVK